VVFGTVQRSVGPIERDVVRQRHVPRAEVIILAKQGKRILDRVPSLQSEQRADGAAREVLPNGTRRERPLQLRVFRDHAPRDVDLLELHACVARRAAHGTLRFVGRVVALTGDVDRPELAADVSGFEPSQIGHARRALAEVIRLDVARVQRVFANAPRQIVVPVHNGGGSQHAERACHVRVGSGGCRCLCHERRRARGSEAKAEKRFHHPSGVSTTRSVTGPSRMRQVDPHRAVEPANVRELPRSRNRPI
jgi:hypothetical protein